MKMIGRASVDKPWLKYFPSSVTPGVFPRSSIYEELHRVNTSYPNDIAICYFDKKFSFAQLFSEIEKAASAFYALGIRKGDIVTFASVNSPELIFMLYGLNKIGASMMVLDPRRGIGELERYAKAANSKMLVVLDMAYEHFSPVIPSLEFQKVIVLSLIRSMPEFKKPFAKIKLGGYEVPFDENTIDYDRFISYGVGVYAPKVSDDGSTVASVTFSGGTTGLPKGVMITNDGFNSVGDSLRSCGVTKRQERFLGIVPPFASYGLISSIHMPLICGLELVLIPKIDPDKLGKVFKKYRPNHCLMVPGFYGKLMESKQMGKPNSDLSFLITAGSGGDTMNLGLETKLNNYLSEHGCKYPLSQGYGMSEMSSAVSCLYNGIFKSLSVGLPLLHTTVAIFKPNSTEELPYNEEGEICMCGPAIMAGYMGNKEETDKVMYEHPDGNVWVHSGDLGRMDEDGFLYITGRIKRTITRADGHKVFPVELENIISSVEGVEECASVGVRDRSKDQGHWPVAAIVLSKGFNKEDVLKRIREKCEREIDFRSRPKEAYVLESMPYVGMGKIDYNRVSELCEFEEDKKELKKVEGL